MRINRFIRKNRWYDSAILIFFISAFVVATFNHVSDQVRGGLFPYARWYGAPEFFNWYWTSLTLLDPLAICALIIHIRSGYIFGLCIMLTDVPINLYANFTYWKLPFHQNYALIMQASFMVFLLFTMGRIWKLSGADRHRDA